jgi:hypothetical protein
MKLITTISFKSLYAFLAICLACAPTPLYTQKALDQTNKLQPHRQSVYVSSGNYIAICALLLLTLHANKIGKDYKEQCEPLTLLKNFGEVYATLAATTLSHELGHAIGSYLLSNTPFNVHLGSRDTKKEALCQIGPISIDSFNPMVGYSYIRIPSSNYKKIIVYAAGPIGGILGCYICKIAKIFLKKIKSKKNNLSSLSKLKNAIKSAFKKTSPLDSIAMYQMLILLIPMGNWSDGSNIWKHLGVHENTVNRVGAIGPLIIYALPTLFSLIVSKQQNKLKDKALLQPSTP